MLDSFFAPYAEYTLRTTLAEVEIRDALKRECGFSFANWKKWLFAGWHSQKEVSFSMVKNRREIVLVPGCRGRNSARGQVHLTLEKDLYSADTILHVVIRPADMRWFCLLWLGLLLAGTVGIVFSRKWLLLIPVPFMFGGFFLIMHFCRAAGEQEIPLIRHSFESLIKQVEGTK